MKRLQEMRKSHGLNQKQLGEILGAAQNSISNWERGIREMDNETLQKAADYFGVTIDYLLERTDYPFEPNPIYLEAAFSNTREDTKKAPDEMSEADEKRKWIDDFLRALPPDEHDRVINAMVALYPDIAEEVKKRHHQADSNSEGR